MYCYILQTTLCFLKFLQRDRLQLGSLEKLCLNNEIYISSNNYNHMANFLIHLFNKVIT